jgi:hypothetical protein
MPTRLKAASLLKICLSGLLLAGLVLAAHAGDEPDARGWAEIRAVIQSQLDAFAGNDEAAAFSHASPAIHDQYKTPANFMRMVRESYQAIYRPRAVKFLEPAVIQGEVIQAVQVIAPDGAVRVALYSMQRQPDGKWKINGCLLAPSVRRMT